MVLKRVTIKGFKSFADKTQLDFNQGVTAIVGPNGCGKSNILDSIRWVLGEQNPRLLRGMNMQDVIFGGTETRKAEGMAEVSMLLDNSNRVFPMDFSEILVTRRLFRSGESDYLINKTPCRLKDITELFMDTGIGKSTYSIMEQGRVEQLLNSKPMERRVIFEEAAGITKYKARRDEALRKLNRTEQDLVRLSDILAELGRQVRSLKRQAGLAERYERYLEQLQQMELTLIARKARQLEHQLEETEAQGKSCEDRKQALTARRATLHADLTRTTEQLTAMDEDLHQLAERQISLRAEMERWDEKAQSAQERRKELEARKVRLNEEGLDAEKRLEIYRQQLEERRHHAETHQQEVNQAAEEAGMLDKKIEQLRSLVTAQQETVEHLRQGILRLQNELTAGENDQRRFERERELISIQGQKLTAQQIQLAEEAAQLEEAYQEKDAGLTVARRRQEDLEVSCGDIARQLEEVTRQWEFCTAEFTTLQAEIHARSSRLSSLVELQRNYEGYKDGVKFLLQERARQDSALQPQCKGTLAEMMKVEKGYELAIEIALAYALQYLIVEQEEEAIRLLQALSQGDCGRAGFVALDSLTHRQLPSIPEQVLSSGVRRASDVVSFPESLQSLAALLFGDILIVSDLDTARRLRQGWEGGYQWITLQGELIDARGILSGGSHTEGGLLSRKREIEELQESLSELEGRRDTAGQRGEELKERRQQLQERLEMDATERHQLLIQLAKLEEEIAALTRQKERLLRSQDVVSEEQIQRMQELSRLEEDLHKTRDRLDRVRQEFHDASARFEQEEALLHEKRGELKQMELLRQECAVLLAERRKDLERSRAEVLSLGEQIIQLERLVANRSEERESIESQIEMSIQQIAEARAKSEELLVEVQKLEGAVAESRFRRQAFAEQKDQEETGLLEVDEEYRGLDRKTVEMESARVRLQLEKEDLARRLKNDFEKEYSQWTTFDLMEERPQEEIQEEADSLRSRMQRLGPVNRLAKAEYDELNERFEFLTKQKDDLEKARANLLRTISEIKRTARERFQTVFEEIRDNFRKTFRTMFGGGRADLLLLNEEDVIESGIEIVAQPPGKNLQSISLLSGGEKALTAISLLFAIYLIKPSPFCILDEIDAPLDDANIGRFNKVLRNFTDRSQFLIITHNKRSMEMADVIYGVTMSERGISEIMSMNFERTKHPADGADEPMEESQPMEPEISDEEKQVLLEKAQAEPVEQIPQAVTKEPEDEEAASETFAPEAEGVPVEVEQATADEPTLAETAGETQNEPSDTEAEEIPRAKNGTPLEPYVLDENSVQFDEDDFVPHHEVPKFEER